MGRFSEVLNQSFRSGATTGYTGHIATIGSVAITNASIAVDVTVADYVSVTQSGAYITTLGSQAITNLPASYNGSVYQSTNPWITLGSQAITNTVDILGSVHINNNTAGSVMYQGTNPWIVLGSVNVANQGYLGSTFYLSGLQDVAGSVAVTNTVDVLGSVNATNFWLTSKEHIAVPIGSPYNTTVFAQEVNRVVVASTTGSAYYTFDSIVMEDKGIYIAPQSTVELNVPCGSVMAYGGGVGSLFVIGIY